MRNDHPGLPHAVHEYELAEQADRRTRAVVLLVSILFFVFAVAVLVSSIHSVR